MASYATKVKRDIDRWLAEGMVDAATAARLAADVDLHAVRGVSFGSVLAILSAVVFGASILIFVAANWSEIPRLVRVGLLFAFIAAGYVGGAVMKRRGHPAFAEAGYVVAGAAFGASIALIGQMYHLTGDERAAVLTWCAGVAVGAGLLRSGVSTAAAVALAGSWMWMGAWDFWRDKPVDIEYLAILAALWALSLWTSSRASRHLVLLSLTGYAVLTYLRSDQLVIPTLLAIASVALFLFAVWMPAMAARWLRLESGVTLQALFGFGVAMTLLQFAFNDEWPFMVLALLSFAGIVGALMLAGREDRLLRWMAYVQFSLELSMVYVVTVGSMLGTAGFLLAPGFLLAMMAWVVLRLERRMRAPQALQGEAT